MTSRFVVQEFLGLPVYMCISVEISDLCLRSCLFVGPQLVNITSSPPMEIVCLYYLSLKRSKGGHKNILVITDHFSRYAQAIPTRNQTAKTTARVLFDNFIVHYGFPARIHSDQGQTLSHTLFRNFAGLPGWRSRGQHPIIPWKWPG